MTFLVPDEFILLMSPSPDHPLPSPYYLTPQNKIDLGKAGIQTAQESLDWNRLEPVRGDYDFSSLDEIIKANRNAGIKTRIRVPGRRGPVWMPDEWMLKKEDGSSQIRGDQMGWRQPSFWNEEAQEHCDKFLEMLVERYPDVLFVYGEFQEGEGVLPGAPFFYDKFAIADYKEKHGSGAHPNINTQETRDWLQTAAIKRIIRAYKVINRHGEIWNFQQLLMDDWTKTCINYAQKDIMRACKKEFPDSNLVLEQDTYFDATHTERHRSHVDEIKEEFQCDVIVEALWPQGLPTTTPKAIARGYRGQIVGVSHQHVPENVALEHWMLVNIQNSHRQWVEAGENK